MGNNIIEAVSTFLELKSISMSAALFRTSTAARSALRAGAPKKAAAMASTSFVRGKATLPEPPPNIRQQLQRRNRATPGRRAQTRYRGTDCSAAIDQLPRRWTHQSYFVLGESRSKQEWRWW